MVVCISSQNSQLKGCGVDNVLIKVYGDEIPILDGSAAPFSELIRGVGLKEQDKKRVFLKILNRVSVIMMEN